MNASSTPPKIVALCGAIGSGKDTVADYLVDEFGYEHRKFSDELKGVCRRVFEPLGAERRHFYGTQADKAETIPGLNVSGRRILEVVGTEGFRAVYSDVWARLALLGAERVVLSDLRFTNEYTLVRAAGGVVWRTVRAGHERTRTGHVSDSEWPNFSVHATLLAPNGGIESLHEQARALIRAGGVQLAELKNA